MSRHTVGFVGLGNMGGALAGNLVAHGCDVVAYDAAGPDRVPEGASAARNVAEVADRAEVLVFSLPNGEVCEKVAHEVLAAGNRRVSHIVDTSTSGVTAARSLGRMLAEHGVGYVDAPVSGGVAGARARTLTVMYAGADEACAHVEPVLAGLSDRRLRVGDSPGMAQAMKLANNFLAATTLAATSEAVAFGLAAGLDMGAMLEVLNASSGQSNATSVKFPEQVLTGRYAAGFANSLMSKDVQLYLCAVREQEGPSALGAVTASLWETFAADEPGADFTRVFPFVRDS